MPKHLVKFLAGVFASTLACLALTSHAQAYPQFAQQGYEEPREPTGRIVCANCHLAAKPVDIELPQAVFPDSVFEANIQIPYDKKIKQVLGNGKKGGLNVGAVLILPDGFQIAPSDRIPEEISAKVGKLSFQPYSPEKKNIIIVGPLPGKKYMDMTFPILSPKKEGNINYGTYPIYLGANRGRGQVYPTGEKSNNTIYTSSANGVIESITKDEKDGSVISIRDSKTDQTITETVPVGPSLVVSVGDTLTSGQPLSNNPNVGGFGQADSEIVLQNPLRVELLIAFLGTISVAQIFLVLKKKQFEKVQLAEMNF